MSDQTRGIGQAPEGEDRRWVISRRGFLIGMAATGAAVAPGIPLGLPILRRAAAGLTEGDAGGFATGTLDPLLWFELYPDERIRVFVPKAEIVEEGYDLSLSRYKEEVFEEIEYKAPGVILKRLTDYEHDILNEIDELNKLLM